MTRSHKNYGLTKLSATEHSLIFFQKVLILGFSKLVDIFEKICDTSCKSFFVRLWDSFIYLAREESTIFRNRFFISFLGQASLLRQHFIHSPSQVLFRLLLHRLLNTDLLTFTQVSATSFDLFLHYILSQSKSISCVGSICTVEIHLKRSPMIIRLSQCLWPYF